MNKILYLFFSVFLLDACAQDLDSKRVKTVTSAIHSTKDSSAINEKGTTIETRFQVPEGYSRTKNQENSFDTYLRSLPLKPHNSEVLIYNGRIKENFNVYDAVVDLEIGKRDLHQCADAVMRLRAEYLWKNNRYDEIHFNFTNGFRVDYTEWMKGRRIIVNGNKTSWSNRIAPSNTYKDFWKYMEMIFSYAGTLSLSKELESIDIQKIEIGHVFIQGGSPGHAIIVVDMATNSEGKKMFLLAQSYMPAQEIQILKNPSNLHSPWYSISDSGILSTPEWQFYNNDLKQF